MKSSSIIIHTTTVAVIFSFLVHHVQGQAMGCRNVEDCILESDLSCQDWLDSTYDWQGQCCSLQDVVVSDNPNNTSSTTTKCRLITVGSCSFQTPSQGCPLDSGGLDLPLVCFGSQTVISVDGSEQDECPDSPYDPFASTSLNFVDTDSPTMSPTLAPTLSIPKDDIFSTQSPTTTNTAGELGQDENESQVPQGDTPDISEIVIVCGDFEKHVFRGVQQALRERPESGYTVHSGSCPELDCTDPQQLAINFRAFVDKGQPCNSHGRSIGGILISVPSAEILAPVIDHAVVERGIPVVTFESDAPQSQRLAHVGTNNTFFGIELAKNLVKIKPNGGSYMVVTAPQDHVIERTRAFQEELNAEGGWVELEGSPLIVEIDPYRSTRQARVFEQMQKLVQQNKLVLVDGVLMNSPFWREFVDFNRHRNITIVSGDGTPVQVSLLLRNYAQGLIGRIPFEMGYEGSKILLDALEGKNVSRKMVGTNVIAHTKVPFVLPPLKVDHNHIGGLRYVGFTLFGLVAIFCGLVGVWTWFNRKVYVVQASQPVFLIMVAAGVFIMSASIIPLSMDDNEFLYQDEEARRTGICMSVPWLAWTGFTVTFSALFSKTWRVNQVMQQPGFQRVQVQIKQVLGPFSILLLLNFAILTIWTILDPLVYTRQPHPGTDGWNRVISTYGSCQSENVVPYLIILLLVNIGVLAIANWQAYRARNLQSEFAESKYIGLTMGSMMQASIMGVPILFIVRENPQAFYLLLVFTIFFICFSCLAFIFAPKIVFAESFKQKTPQEQARFIRQAVRSACTSSASPSKSNSSNPSHWGLSGSFDSFGALSDHRRSSVTKNPGVELTSSGGKNSISPGGGLHASSVGKGSVEFTDQASFRKSTKSKDLPVVEEGSHSHDDDDVVVVGYDVNGLEDGIKDNGDAVRETEELDEEMPSYLLDGIADHDELKIEQLEQRQ